MSDVFKDSLMLSAGLCEKLAEKEKELEQKDQRIKVLERAFENLAKNCEKESCYYCPCGYCGEDRCHFGDDSEECIAIIKEHFISQAEKEIKDET